MLSNGFLVVFSAIQRVPPPGDAAELVLVLRVSARLRIGIGGWPESQHMQASGR